MTSKYFQSLLCGLFLNGLCGDAAEKHSTLAKSGNYKPSIVQNQRTRNFMKQQPRNYLENERNSELSARKYIDNNEMFPDTLLLMAALKKYG